MINGKGVEIPVFQAIVGHRNENGDISFLSTIASDISETKRYSLLMEQSQEAAHIGGWEVDCITNEVHWTRETYAIHGLQPHEYNPTVETATQFYTASSLPIIRNAVECALKYGENYNLELELLTAKGNRIWVRTIGKAIVKDGRTTKLYGSFQDITESRRNEEQLKFVMEGSNDGFWDCDWPPGKVTFSPRWAEMLGYTVSELGTNFDVWTKLVHPEDKPIVEKALMDHINGLTPLYQVDHRLQAKSGEWRWILTRGKAVSRDAQGKVTRLCGTHTDITERKKTEAALYESEERNRSIVAALAEGIVFQDATGRLIDCNPSAEQILGFPLEQIMGRTSIDPSWQAVHEDGSPFPGETHPPMVTLRTGVPQSGVIMGLHKQDGALFWISINTQPLMQEGEKQPYGVVSSFHDITKRKHAEEALRESEAQLLEAQQIAHLGSWVIELSNNTSIWSDEMYQIFEIDKKQVSNPETPFFALLHPDDRKLVKKSYYTSLNTRSAFELIHRILFPDGRIKFLQVRGVHHYDISGQPIRSVGTVQDITERRVAEEVMMASLKEKDAMLKEIHHRVKNNLQIINSLLNIQSAQVKDAAVMAAFTETKHRVRSMALLHETLYKSESFARIDLSSYIHSLCAHLSRSYGTNAGNIKVLIDIAEIELDLDRAIPIGLIINELVSNALKYAFIENYSGTISVKILKLDDKISLTVSDNGKGFPQEIDLHNTESLGLNLVCDLTHQLKGTLALHNVNGTVFNILFPY